MNEGLSLPAPFLLLLDVGFSLARALPVSWRGPGELSEGGICW